MTASRTVYCTSCARPGDATAPYCANCGSPRAIPRQKRAGHVAFLLNELQEAPLTLMTTPEQRASLSSVYEAQLRELTAPEPRRRQAPAAQPPTPAAIAVSAPAVARRAPAAPRAPRAPRDWSWLAEQQANLFLFAGAFLTVVAALIYVGYSGQAVSGALKMSLLVGYTLAFLAGGALCLRYPRVATAGQVFFGIGAVLVPLNFAAADSIIEGRDLSRESLWLAGSLVTAIFYSAIAYIGFSRVYAVGGAVALISATLAACVVADTPVEWTPVVFIAVAFAMLLAQLYGGEVLRTRIGAIWSVIGQLVAVAAMASALLIAPFAGDEDIELVTTTRWYLPVTFAAFALAALVPMLRSRGRQFGLGVLAGYAGAFVSVAYALDVAGENYAVAFGALSVTLGALVLAARHRRIAAALPSGAGDAAYVAGVAATALAGAVAALALAAANDEEAASYVIRSRWFLPTAVTLAGSFFVAMSFVRKQAADLAAAAAAAFALSLALNYAFNLPAEAYAIASAGMAVAFGALVVAVRRPRIRPLLAPRAEDVLYAAGAIAGVAAVIVTASVLEAAARDIDAYDIRTRWFALISAALAGAFFVAMAFVRSQRLDVIVGGAAAIAAAVAAVFALGMSAEYYAFALLAPALALAAAARWIGDRPAVRRLASTWRDDAVFVGAVAAIAGMALAAVLAMLAEVDDFRYSPDARAFLPMAFLGGAAFFSIDASRRREAGTSAAFVVAIIASAFTTPYAFDAGAEYYGLALAVAGIGVAALPRVWSPSWLHETARDLPAVAAIALSTLPFEGAYAGATHIGAGVHVGAALVFALAAVRDRSRESVGRLAGVPALENIRVAMGWLYAAGAAAVIGYIFVLRGSASDAQASTGTIAFPLMAASVAFMLAGVVLRRLREEFTPHLYVMSLALALGSVAAADSAGATVVLLTVYVFAYAALAVHEDRPLIAAPAVVFGLAAVEAWRRHAGADLAAIPFAYAAAAVAMYAGALAVRRERRRWSNALRGTGALYALLAPVAGFAILAYESENGLVGATAFEQTALYQVSTIAVAIVGGIALVESMLARRRWVIVPASAVLLVALLLQIARLDPANAQAYSAPIGVYLVLLAALGLSRLRLIPELEPAAVYVEAVGAGTIMLPTFAQSLDGGWYYHLALVIESAAFFSAGVALRRRGLLTAALAFMVLLAGRALLDAVNALPNWIIVMIAGMSLLAIGMGILAGRDRWEQWQRTLLAWWTETGDNAVA